MEHGDAPLVNFVFDMLFLDGDDLTDLPLVDRKTRLEACRGTGRDPLQDHQVGNGPAFYKVACQHSFRGHRLQTPRWSI